MIDQRLNGHEKQTHTSKQFQSIGKSVISQWSFSGPSVLGQWLFGYHSVVIQWSVSDYSVFIQGSFNDHSVVNHWSFSRQSLSVQAMIRPWLEITDVGHRNKEHTLNEKSPEKVVVNVKKVYLKKG